MDRVKKIIESNEMVVHLDTIEGIYWQVMSIRRVELKKNKKKFSQSFCAF